MARSTTYEEELKPCPFCGSNEILVVRDGESLMSCIIKCESCGCTLESNEIGHGEAWNRRVDKKDH